MPVTVLIVEDEGNLARSIGQFLSRRGFDPLVAESMEEGWKLFQQVGPHITLLDHKLPDGDGLRLLKRIREADPEALALVITAYAKVADAVEAMKLGAFDYIQKPLDMEQLLALLGRAAERIRLRQEVSYYREKESGELLGRSQVVLQVLRQMEQLVSAGGKELPTVLLTGETGTGKGLAARFLHRKSARSAGPFIEVTCTTLPASLVESELFGFDRGAFTDARQPKPGLFEAAEGGTLFLDEIGDLPLELQGKLLRVLESKTVRRLGSVRDRPIDVWILAATNRDLAKLVAQGQFRADLHYRLQIVTIGLPPLRERKEDIPLLAEYFLRLHSRRYHRPVRRFSREAEQALLCYPWPGNVRELSHVVEQAVLLAKGEELQREELRIPQREGPPEEQSKPTGGSSTADLGNLLDRFLSERWSLSDVEKALIERALVRTGGNCSRAARLLGVTRDILRYRMEKYGILRPSL
jgi:two-component system response regulator AtoC